MSIPLNYKINKIYNEVRLKCNLRDNDTEWMAWWYCGLYKNHMAESQPNAVVAFRELSAGNLSDDIIIRKIPLTALGQVRIGTVWKDGVCRSEAIFDTWTFTVDFTNDSWKFNSLHESCEKGLKPPYPQSIHPIRYHKDKNWLIEFRLPTGGKLIIPCMEFFSRCYGRSQELNRVLATYPWHGENSVDYSRLYAPIDEQEEEGKWKVKLRKRLVNGDVIFLAHAKYDSYTEKEAKNIYAQIEFEYDPEKITPLFIQVGPWFTGIAEIKVQGIWFDDKQSFLALRIIGCSDPGGVPIIRDRDDMSNANNSTEEAGAGDEGAGIPNKVLSTQPEIIDLTGNAEPDHDTAMIEIHDSDFEVLGHPRVVIDVRKARAKDGTGSRTEVDVTEFSSGENYSSEKGVGYAAIHARQIMESKGMLQDMWNAMLFLMEKQPDLIQSVNWFTFQDKFSESKLPKLIALQPFDTLDEKKEIDNEARNWAYLDKSNLKMRGVLVARLISNGIPIYILEIQRKPRKKKDHEGTPKDAEESFRGLVFMPNDNCQFETCLQEMLSGIRNVRGVVNKLVGLCPGKAATFKHGSAVNEQMPCEVAVLNALHNIGVTQVFGSAYLALEISKSKDKVT